MVDGSAGGDGGAKRSYGSCEHYSKPADVISEFRQGPSERLFGGLAALAAV